MTKKGKRADPSTEKKRGFANKKQQPIPHLPSNLQSPYLRSNSSSPVTYLASLDIRGIRFGIGPIRRLLARLGNPQNAYKTVLIGGTNGKGSIAAMTASILAESGFKVGLYTSPHLIDFRERIQINGCMISEQDVDRCINTVRRKVTEEITWFEFVTAMAFIFFRVKGVEIAVLEVGMGGRLDATNVCRPMVSAISNISLEHRAYLGNRLADIAQEKAGIIRRRSVCISAVKQTDVKNVLMDICSRKRTKLFLLGRDFKVRKCRDGSIDYYGPFEQLKGITCPLKGRHQLDNTATALAIIERLRERGISISTQDIVLGMKKAKWEGRLEVIGHNPQILLDGAHNPAGISALCKALKEEFSYRRLIVVFGALSDKDIGRMLNPLCRLTHCLILTRPEVNRASSTTAVFQMARRYHNLIRIFESVHDAVKYALKIAKKGDMICVTGSLYLIGEVKKAFPFSGDYVKHKQSK